MRDARRQGRHQVPQKSSRTKSASRSWNGTGLPSRSGRRKSRIWRRLASIAAGLDRARDPPSRAASARGRVGDGSGRRSGRRRRAFGRGSKSTRSASVGPPAARRPPRRRRGRPRSSAWGRGCTASAGGSTPRDMAGTASRLERGRAAACFGIAAEGDGAAGAGRGSSFANVKAPGGGPGRSVRPARLAATAAVARPMGRARGRPRPPSPPSERASMPGGSGFSSSSSAGSASRRGGGRWRGSSRPRPVVRGAASRRTGRAVVDRRGGQRRRFARRDRGSAAASPSRRPSPPAPFVVGVGVRLVVAVVRVRALREVVAVDPRGIGSSSSTSARLGDLAARGRPVGPRRSAGEFVGLDGDLDVGRGRADLGPPLDQAPLPFVFGDQRVLRPRPEPAEGEPARAVGGRLDDPAAGDPAVGDRGRGRWRRARPGRRRRGPRRGSLARGAAWSSRSATAEEVGAPATAVSGRSPIEAIVWIFGSFDRPRESARSTSSRGRARRAGGARTVGSRSGCAWVGRLLLNGVGRRDRLGPGLRPGPSIRRVPGPGTAIPPRETTARPL